MRNQIKKEISTLVSHPQKYFGNVILTLCDYYKGLGQLEINIDGWYDDNLKFNFSLVDVKRLVKWLEQILTCNDQEQNELFLGKRVGSEDEYVLGLTSIDGNNGSYHSLEWQSGLSIPFSECCVVYTYNTTKNIIGRVAFCRTEDIVRSMYTTLRYSKGLRYKSDIIETFFLNKPALKLEYKGYSTITNISKKDLRYYGGVISPDNVEFENWKYAAGNYPE